jgi:predicted nucleic acid-binding protein
MTTFIDTSALVAILDADDPNHADAQLVFQALGIDGDVVTHNYIHAEAAAVVLRRLGRTVCMRLLDTLLPAIPTVWVDQPLHDAAHAAMRASNATASLVDHVSFEVMRRAGITVAFAYDRDFDIAGFVRPVAARGDAPHRLSEARTGYSSAAPAPADLVGVAEIAEVARTSVNTVQSWRRRYRTFPTPLATLAAGPVWNRAAVEAWIDGRRPRALPRRPGFWKGRVELRAGWDDPDSDMSKAFGA